MKSEQATRHTRPCAGAASFDPTSGGQPLPADVRRAMESRFPFDFATVRVHTDSAAADSARAEGAHAYTAGRHIVFAPSQYSPSTTAGRRLLAHELAHVVQQANGVALGTPAQRAEAEGRADAAAEGRDGAAMPPPSRRSTPFAAVPFAIQRNADCSKAEAGPDFDFDFTIRREIYSRSFPIPEDTKSKTVEIEASYSDGAPSGEPGDVCVQIFGCRLGPDTQTDKQCARINGRRKTMTFGEKEGLSDDRTSYLRIWKGEKDGLQITGSGKVGKGGA